MLRLIKSKRVHGIGFKNSWNWSAELSSHLYCINALLSSTFLCCYVIAMFSTPNKLRAKIVKIENCAGSKSNLRRTPHHNLEVSAAQSNKWAYSRSILSHNHFNVWKKCNFLHAGLVLLVLFYHQRVCIIHVYYMYSMYIFLKKSYSRILDWAEAQLLMTETNYGIYEQKNPSKNCMHYKSVSKNLNSENPKAFANTYI